MITFWQQFPKIWLLFISKSGLIENQKRRNRFEQICLSNSICHFPELKTARARLFQTDWWQIRGGRFSVCVSNKIISIKKRFYKIPITAIKLFVLSEAKAPVCDLIRLQNNKDLTKTLLFRSIQLPRYLIWLKFT